MIGAMKQLEFGRKAKDVAREVGVSMNRIYAWKAKYVAQAQEVKRLRDRDERLRKLVADLMLEKESQEQICNTVGLRGLNAAFAGQEALPSDGHMLRFLKFLKGSQ